MTADAPTASGPDPWPMLATVFIVNVTVPCGTTPRFQSTSTAAPAPVCVNVPADTWIQVTGVYTAKRAKDPVNNVDMAYVEVTSWEAIPEPKQPYS